MNLSEIGKRCGTDKGTEHGYLPIYEQYLDGTRLSIKSLLELGIFKGSSLRMWSEYFPNAIIHGLDINVDRSLASERIKIYEGDSGEVYVANQFEDNAFDVIVNDASHLPPHQILSLCWFWPKLKKDGLFFIEDIGCHDWLRYFAPLKPIIYEINKGGKPDDILLVFKK
jgi:demethylmacrocin O-methyltransferase